MHWPNQRRQNSANDDAVQLAECQPLRSTRRSGYRTDLLRIETVAADPVHGARARLEKQRSVIQKFNSVVLLRAHVTISSDPGESRLCGATIRIRRFIERFFMLP